MPARRRPARRVDSSFICSIGYLPVLAVSFVLDRDWPSVASEKSGQPAGCGQW